MRAKKTTQGTTLHQALLAKYSQKFDEAMSVGYQKEMNVNIEIVGADKAFQQQSRLEDATEIYLQNQPISGLGAKGLIEKALPKVTVLDVSRTLVSSWDTVLVRTHSQTTRRRPALLPCWYVTTRRRLLSVTHS